MRLWTFSDHKWILQIHLWNRRVNTYITLLTHISACANPITYCFINKRLRRNITTYLWTCTFQACREPLQEKVSIKIQTASYSARYHFNNPTRKYSTNFLPNFFSTYFPVPDKSVQIAPNEIHDAISRWLIQ